MRVKPYNQEKIKTEILSFLKLNGKSNIARLKKHFPYSQSFFSRIFKLLDQEIIILGKARETEYAAKRIIDGKNSSYPIYEILEDSSSLKIGILYAIEPKGFYFLSHLKNISSEYSVDLPYFLNDLRPSGFLGHLVPNLNPELNLPKDIRIWSSEHCLKYLTTKSFDNIGNLIIGDLAFQKYLSQKTQTNGIEFLKRAEQFELYANNVLSYGEPGSSAGGEQPKFLSNLLPQNKQVLVKFSPPLHSDIGVRVADLLICEHLALNTLHKNNIESAQSEIIFTKNRIFLELERFDRIPNLGRKGLITLGSLDAEFSGTMGTWSETSINLMKKKIIPKEFYNEIRLLELFGHFIGNNDMHLFNLSFYFSKNKVIKIAPVYDMLPMLFRPMNNQIVPKTFSPPLPLPEDSNIWDKAYQLAIQFWNAVLNDKNISSSFKVIAQDCLFILNKQKDIGKLLPK
ncbi:hypothetical protein GCL60_05760 [Silvanigrella paludirubra]|uniref:RGS domain-containing protein n=1 Tax=Silvanigrella paludirubra TaxID=2499159 RepID=A0A6N6VVH7_9BACT|nr:HipA domain-containing protein [Silvanigrella paludirubra]KAB8039769.1 hypothetical protein GCL60_05760 [Silvanigrella paludirubra]